MGTPSFRAAFSAALGAILEKRSPGKGVASYLAQSYFGIWQVMWIVRLVFVSQSYCATEYHVDADADKLCTYPCNARDTVSTLFPQ